MGVREIFEAVLSYQEDDLPGLIEKELASGTEISEILNAGLIAAMEDVGKRFASGDLFIPEMIMAAKVMKIGLEVLRPRLSSTDLKPKATVVIGTVEGDSHDIGKNLVGMMLEGGGFQVIDLGVNVSKAAFISVAKDKGAQIIGLSSLLTTTMPAMEATVAAIKEENRNFKTLVGGAPVTREFAEQIGATGYASDAPMAVELARKVLEA